MDELTNETTKKAVKGIKWCFSYDSNDVDYDCR